MGVLESSIHDARLLGWCLLFSAVNGAIVLGIAGLAGADFPWHQGLVGGAVVGPALTLLFETPVRALVRVLAQIPYCGWVLVLPLVAMRYAMSWPAVMVANQVMGSRTGGAVARPERSLAPQRHAPPAPAPLRAAVGNGCDRCNGRALLGNGDGKCARCHGTGKIGNVMAAMAASLSSTSQDCGQCSGTGRCTDCDGKGYLR